MAATPNPSDYLIGNGPAASVHTAGDRFAVWCEALPGDNTIDGLTAVAMAATLRDILALPAD